MYFDFWCFLQKMSIISSPFFTQNNSAAFSIR
jgi:hypothetical protein